MVPRLVAVQFVPVDRGFWRRASSAHTELVKRPISLVFSISYIELKKMSVLYLETD